MMLIHDIDHNGTIAFHEFKAIFGDFDEQKAKMAQQ